MTRQLKSLRRFPSQDGSYTFRGLCQECGMRGRLHRYISVITGALVWGCDECDDRAASARGFLPLSKKRRALVLAKWERVIEAGSW